MRLKTLYIPVIFAVVLFLGIGGFNVAGLWKVESSKVPITIKEGEFAGEFDPGDIRGSYSFGDIQNNFRVDAAIIAEAFGIDTETPEMVLCKDLENIYPAPEGGLELGTGSIRQVVAIYTGLPYEGDDGFPSTAIKVLRREGKWTDALEATLSGRIVELTGSSMTVTEPAIQGNPDDSTIEHDVSIGVKGKTTVAEVIDWGISKEAIEDILGVKVDNVNLLIRDICTENDLSFGEIKTTLNVVLGVE